MSAIRCKEIIDSGAGLAGRLICLGNWVALNGAQGREPSDASVKRFQKRSKELDKAINRILEEVSG